MQARVATLPGDGIGAEITTEAVKVLKAVGSKYEHEFETTELPIGWAAIDEHGEALPDFVRQECAKHDAVFMGAVGLPGRDETLPQEKRPERAAILPLREGNYANLRPISLPECMARPDRPAVDILMVRELNGGIYMGGERGRREVDGVVEAFDTMKYSAAEIVRVAKIAFEACGMRRKQLCSVDKANILASSALWRETVTEIGAGYPDVALRHQLVDSAAPALVQRPTDFDVILTSNLFGDILSDLGGVLAGSLGMLPSASIGGEVGLYEPAHGSAPDIMGKDMANPIASILTMGMLLEFSLGLKAEAAGLKKAVLEVLESGRRTVDIMEDGCRQTGTAEFGDLVAERIAVG